MNMSDTIYAVHSIKQHPIYFIPQSPKFNISEMIAK